VLPKGKIKEGEEKTAGKSPETILHRMGGFLSLALGMRKRMPHRCHDEKACTSLKYQSGQCLAPAKVYIESTRNHQI